MCLFTALSNRHCLGARLAQRFEARYVLQRPSLTRSLSLSHSYAAWESVTAPRPGRAAPDAIR